MASAFVLGGVLLFLVSPRVPPGSEKDYFVSVIDIKGPIHIIRNCDSSEFELLARRPSLLFTHQHKLWQSRPGYIALGWFFSQPIRILGFDRVAQKITKLPLAAENAAYIFWNWILLSLSILLLLYLCRSSSWFSPAILLSAVMLVCNEVTKAFFWTPHLQIFNVFTPLLTVALSSWLLSRQAPLRWHHIELLGILLGLGAMAYGAFLVTLGAAVLCIWIRGNTNPLPKRFRQSTIHSILLVFFFFLPMALWVLYVRAQAGSFYSHEVVAYRQFIWLYDSFLKGFTMFWVDIGKNLVAFVNVLAPVLAFPALMLVFVHGLSITLGISRNLSRHESCVYRAVFITLLVSLPFYALMGFYATRLAWALVPPLVIILALEGEGLICALKGSQRFFIQACLTGTTIGYMLYWVLKAGPYS